MEAFSAEECCQKKNRKTCVITSNSLAGSEVGRLQFHSLPRRPPTHPPCFAPPPRLPLRTSEVDGSLSSPELGQVFGAQHIFHLRVSRQFQLTQGAQAARRDESQRVQAQIAAKQVQISLFRRSKEAKVSRCCWTHRLVRAERLRKASLWTTRISFLLKSLK